MVGPRRARPPRKTAVLFASLLVGACFDPPQVDPGPCGALLVDDFEDGDLMPSASGFDPWRCSTFRPDGQPTTCDVGEGHDSTGALVSVFTLQDPADGRNQTGGAAVTVPLTKAMDLSGYLDLVVSVRLESGSAPLPNATVLEVALACGTAPVERLDLVEKVSVDQSVGAIVDHDWSTFRLALLNFGQPVSQGNHLVGGPAACLARIDGISFQVAPNLADGQTVSGALRIDDVKLANACAR